MALNKRTYTDYAKSIPITASNLNDIQDAIIEIQSREGLAVCSTAAGTAAKTATLGGFVLQSGVTARVKFTYSNTAATPTLNINSTGAKPIKRVGSEAIGTTPETSWPAGAVVHFAYDGTNWIIVSTWGNMTNAALGQGYGTCSTSASTVDKLVTLANYAPTLGGVIAVKFTYAVPASATLNVNSKGAYPIMYKGAAITADVIAAGDTATFLFDGTNYQLLSTDTSIGEPIVSDVYSPLATYKIGEYCIHNNTLYRCKTAINTAEAWNSNHWVATTVAAEIEDRVLWLPGVTVSATTGNIVDLSDDRITTDHVLASCTWANDSYITALSTWSTQTVGTLKISGTCTTATTADILLVKKNN